MGVCWSGSQLVVVVDWCWWLTAGRRQQSDDRMLEEEEHGSCTFCVVAPAVNENMAADRNMQCCREGEGDRNGGLLLVVEVADQNWCICVEVFEADGSSSELEPEQPQQEVPQ